jgi:hypothetical protein
VASQKCGGFVRNVQPGHNNLLRVYRYIGHVASSILFSVFPALELYKVEVLIAYNVFI